MNNRLEKTFVVTITVDKNLAREMKMGQQDWGAYPNWDINYLGDEERFIATIMEELEDHSNYSGIYIDIKEAKNG